MKISNLSALIYGLSSSATSFAFTNYQRRSSSTRAMRYRNAIRTHSSQFGRNYPGQRQNGVYQYFGFALKHSRSFTTDAADTQTTSDPESLSSSTPFFRLFYNDVYEVNLPPKHRFPMGKYRKVRERVQEKVAKSRLGGVECGKFQWCFCRHLSLRLSFISK